MEWIGKLGIDQDRVWSALGIKGIEDVGIKELTTLTGLKTAIKDGDSTIDEAFPSMSGKPSVEMPREKTEPTSEKKETVEPDFSGDAQEPVDPSDKVKYVCSICKTEITEKVHTYSVKLFKTALCFKCQKSMERK